MKRLKSVLSLVLGLFISSLILGQPIPKLTAHYGFIIPHREEIENLIQNHSWGVNADFLLKYKNEKFWHRAWSYPHQTWTLTYLNTGNPAQLGSHYSVLHQLYLPLQKTSSSHRLKQHLALGVGLGYTTRVWNQNDNHQAVVLGSHVNTALAMQYGLRFPVGRLSAISVGLRLAHFSNGSLKTPNLGTNNFSVFVSTDFQTRQAVHRDPVDTSMRAECYRFRISSGYSFGLKEILPPGERKYFVNAVNLGMDVRRNVRYSYCLGFDLMRNSSLPQLMKERSDRVLTANELIQWGVNVGYIMHFNRFDFRLQQGFYCLDRYRMDGLFYQRIGLRYWLTDRLVLSVMLKTHFAKADYGEYGIGYSVSWRKQTYHLKP